MNDGEDAGATCRPGAAAPIGFAPALTDQELAAVATRLRRTTLEMLNHAQAGHPGGSLSAAEIMAVLYFDVMRIDSSRPVWDDRDRFVLSKGHAAPIYYATLTERGFLGEELLCTYDEIDSCLQAHPATGAAGIDACSGSLGQGLSMGIGMALGARLQEKDLRVFVLLGDGELQEGQVWEAAMAAPHFKLDHLTAIVDYNGIQLFGRVGDLMPVEPLAEKWRAFGWHVLEIDGHDVGALRAAFSEAAATEGRPTAIIARTVKGKGVSFMEDTHEWHSAAVTDEVLARALAELGSADTAAASMTAAPAAESPVSSAAIGAPEPAAPKPAATAASAATGTSAGEVSPAGSSREVA